MCDYECSYTPRERRCIYPLPRPLFLARVVGRDGVHRSANRRQHGTARALLHLAHYILRLPGCPEALCELVRLLDAKVNAR